MINLSERDQETFQNLDTRAFPVFIDGKWSFQSSLSQFNPIYLTQMGKAALMNRLETKYIFNRDQISDFLFELKNDYRVLEIRGQRICGYRTVYYDTADFYFFQQHQNGSGKRWKIRQRTYLDSQANFLEVKFKDNRKRTQKNRVQADFNLEHILENQETFLSAYAPRSLTELDPKLEVRYTRTTFVKNDGQERVTLDSQLSYFNGKDSQDLDGLLIAEIKQAAYDPTSPFMAGIKKRGIRPSPFSKYCIGTSLLYPDIKHNRFKPTLHHVSSLLGGDVTNDRTL